jgi:hypothetical protein
MRSHPRKYKPVRFGDPPDPRTQPQLMASGSPRSKRAERRHLNGIRRYVEDEEQRRSRWLARLSVFLCLGYDTHQVSYMEGPAGGSSWH